ncbi:RES domain-containing protein [Acinetobacter baumannii]|uniref:RES domain-containing protein n=1 Tax=Acinetobacter baumannii TaxID=470 RepID=UPI0009AAD5E2|nr:RES domain-containing protein [Acinetobacter baumannii]
MAIAMSWCCGSCFSDKKISHFIAQNGSLTDKCSYCGNENVLAVKPAQLFEFIEKVISCFEVNEAGVSLFCLLNEKMHFFNRTLNNLCGLYENIIVGNEDLLEKRYLITNPDETLDEWGVFIEEIKSKNRFFPQTKLYKDIFSYSLVQETDTAAFFSLVETLKVKYPIGQQFFRGRTFEERLNIGLMGMPPPAVASAGRANPVGIPYLYLAENIETCMAEIRPSNGCKVNIAKFNLINEVNLLDLTEPRKRASFMILDEQEISASLKYIDLLEVFAKELSIPILPNNSHLDYIPTQFLCEYFKTICKYDGIIFNSSFGYGKNIVLFTQENVCGEENVDYYHVSQISHNYQLLEK